MSILTYTERPVTNYPGKPPLPLPSSCGGAHRASTSFPYRVLGTSATGFIKSQQINLNSLYNHNKRICYLNQFDMKLIFITILKIHKDPS